MNKTANRKSFSVAIALALCLSASTALAQTQSIPYQGRMEKDGVPSSGDHELRFSLFDAPTGGTALWTQTSTITLNGGHFSAVLANINSAAVQAGELYLSVEVQGPGDAAFVPLQNRQRILPSMYALRSAPQTDFYAADRLGVGKTTPRYDLDVGGPVSAASLVAKGDLRALGTLRAECPPDSHRVGTQCITPLQSLATFIVASRECHFKGMQVCPLKTIMMCDILYHESTAGPLDDWAGTGNECGATTDGQEQNYWTSDVYLRDYDFPMSASTTEAFSHLACYRPTSGSTANSVIECAETSNYRYFCCADVMWTPECGAGADCPPERPLCSDRTCVECTQDSDCPSGETCPDNFCTP